MAALYDSKKFYDPDTMPLVEGWAENNNCVLVRFHWALTENQQKSVDAHWRPDFYRHSLINNKMYLSTLAGAGVPVWDPFYGLSEAEKDALNYEEYMRLDAQSLGTKLARGLPLEPTGLEKDPRMSNTIGEAGDIFEVLRNAGMVSPSKPYVLHHASSIGRAGVWREWEIAEIAREEARLREIEEADARA
jgi:hypothetical protein